MGDKLDYVHVLKALSEIPFGVGKKLLIEFLQGKKKHESIVKNNLYKKESFGSLAYGDDEIGEMIENLIMNGRIKLVAIKGNRFWKVMELTDKGRAEIDDPTLYKTKIAFDFKETEAEITDEERKRFDALSPFLARFNGPQKKSIISDKGAILCIAGAGSGKTTVLTKRIEYLVRYRSVDQKRILAITFTRKARQEMMSRLTDVPGVMIETFNSFSEKMLRIHNDLIYDKQVQMISYKDKIIMMNRALSMLGLDMGRAIDTYFSFGQRRGKQQRLLMNIFMHDCFFIRDYFKFKNRPFTEEAFQTDDVKNQKSAKMIYSICNYIEAHMKKNGLRDFADQLMDTIALFEKHPNLIPKFDHVLIDEYQDINSTQIRLIDLFSAKNIFCVGDPRQSIYGWRGSDIKYILGFKERYKECEIITLKKNYRSTKHIVDLINLSIKKMSLPDLEGTLDGTKKITLTKFDSELREFGAVVQKIRASGLKGGEIFVLARTNRQLTDLSQYMKRMDIKHVVRADDFKKMVAAGENDVTLATIHAIKGLEAEMVFVIGCHGLNFPCKGSDHPVIDMIKIDEYDKEEEERRLFYVAMSRAKRMLHMSYTGKKQTHFITDEMLSLIDETAVKGGKKAAPYKNNFSRSKSGFKKSFMRPSGVVGRLKDWRWAVSENYGVPAFMILHDKALIEISQQMPSTLRDLESISGIGATTIMKYGEEILRIVNS